MTSADSVADLSAYEPLPSGQAQYPLAFMEHQGAVVLAYGDGFVEVGLLDPSNGALVERLRRHHGVPLTIRRIDRTDMATFLARAHSRPPGGDLNNDERIVSPADERLLLDRLANDAPVVNLVNSTIMDAVRRGASDVHVEAFEQEALVRIRIDGELQIVDRVERHLFPAISSRIKVMANLNIMERRIPQDGRFSVHLANDAIDVRVSVVPTVHGESIVLRLLYQRGVPEFLGEIGFDKEVLAEYRRAIESPHGLILISGPTGSGKTTTLNATLRELRCETRKIVAIEDPVEYEIAGVDQIQTNDAIGLTFESLLRRVLRQDPNVIMVGEIRDDATAALAVRAAMTGHLVLSTLHTNDAIGAVERLVDMGVQPFLLAAVLRGTVAQRLVKRVGGGRQALFELFRPDDAARELIAGRAPASKLRAYAISNGMRTLEQAAERAVESGRVDRTSALLAVAR